MLRLLIGLILTLTLGWGAEVDSSAADSSIARNPSKALSYSFFPGGGQLYNKRPMKALLFSGVFIYFGIEYIAAQDDFSNDPNNADLHRTRNDKVWLMALTWTLNLIDAYVDAQLWDFESYPIEEQDIPVQKIIKPKEMELIDEDE